MVNKGDIVYDELIKAINAKRLQIFRNQNSVSGYDFYSGYTFGK